MPGSSNQISDQLLTTSGTPTFSSTTMGNINIATNTISSSNANGAINLAPNGTGATIIGTNAAITGLNYSMQLAAAGQAPLLVLGSYRNTVGSVQQRFYKSRSVTIGSFTAVSSGDNLGQLQFYGDDGAAFRQSAAIDVTAQGAISSGIVPGQFVFQTANTSGTLTTALTISNAQVVTLANALPVASGGTGITSFGTGVATALGQNVNGSGAISLTTSPTFVTPVLGAASATSVSFSSTSGIIGTTTNNDAAAGSVGEFVTASVLSGSAVSLTTATNADITSISLTAGDWDVFGMVGFIPAASTNVTQVFGWTLNASASLPTEVNYIKQQYMAGGVVPGSIFSFSLQTKRFSLASTQTVYLSARAAFTVDTLGAWGYIGARRVR